MRRDLVISRSCDSFTSLSRILPFLFFFIYYDFFLFFFFVFSCSFMIFTFFFIPFCTGHARPLRGLEHSKNPPQNKPQSESHRIISMQLPTARLRILMSSVSSFFLLPFAPPFVHHIDRTNY